jgi:hypothetical protein
MHIRCFESNTPVVCVPQTVTCVRAESSQLRPNDSNSSDLRFRLRGAEAKARSAIHLAIAREAKASSICWNSSRNVHPGLGTAKAREHIVLEG